MTKREHAEIILNYLAEYTIGMDLQFEERDIYPILDSVTNAYAKRNMLENMKLGDPNISDQYALEFKNIEIFFDKDYALCYSNLPAKPIALPNGRGVDFVSGMRNRNSQFYVVNRNQLTLQPEQEIEGNVYCWKEGSRIYYSKRFDETNAPRVFMRLIVSSASSVDADSEYPLDPSVEYEVRKEVINYFMAINSDTQDLTKDGNNESKTQSVTVSRK